MSTSVRLANGFFYNLYTKGGQLLYRFLVMIPFFGSLLKPRLINELKHDQSVTSLLNNLFLSKIDQQDCMLTIPTATLLDRKTVLQTLNEIQFNRIKNSIDPNKKTIAFHFPSSAYRENVGDIPNKLRNRGYNVLVIVGTICKDAYETQPLLYFWNASLEKFDFIDVFISVTLSDNLPASAKKVLFIHDINDSPLGDTNSFLKQALSYNYFTLASEHMLGRLKTIFSSSKTKANATCLIKTGYTKLDRNLEYLKNNKCSNEAIIYAPTVTGLDFDDLVSLPYFGDKIIESLLKNFQEYEIIFRPHPHSLHSDYVKNIVCKYARHARFHLDQEGSFYMPNYAKAALMITDMSGTAFTYAYSTLRPVVFFSHNESEVKRRLNEYNFFKDREKIGYVAQNLDEMVNKVKLLITENDKFAERIKMYRDSTIFNVGKSEDYFVDNIEYILEGKKHPDWIYI